MTKLLTATALSATLLTGAAYAGNDYSDRSEYTCDKDKIESEMAEMIEEGPAGKRGIKLIYIKGDPVEVSRKSNELRCRITIVTNTVTMSGVFRFFNEDGRSLVGWQGGKSK